MKPRTLTFDEARLMPIIGLQIWPKTKGRHETKHYKRCFQLVQKETEKNPNYRIKMSVDHNLEMITFFYTRKDPLTIRMERTVERAKKKLILRKAQELFETVETKARVRRERLRRWQKQEEELKRRQGKATSKKETG
jgi:hypothetical protein